MKKLFLLLIFSFFSTQSLGALDVYECDVKINHTVYEDITYERFNGVDSFIIKFDKNKITFSEDRNKRPLIIDFYELLNTGFLNDDKSLFITGYNGYSTSFHLSHDKKDDYAFLTLSNLNGFDGGIANLIARCSLL